jgi:hypothetical protein
VSRRYENADVSLVVDLFRMASPADAYGVFTHDLEGEEVGTGQGSRYRWGWLSFWQGEVFASITADQETDEAVAAVHELGRRVAAQIADHGELPAVVRRLPAAGLDRGSVRYLHHPQILSSHRFVAVDNPLRLHQSTPAALASYERDGHTALLLVVSYPDVGQAGAALKNVGAALELEAGAEPVRDGGGWQAVARSGARLALVLDCSSAELAAALVSEALALEQGGTP